jgi:hypothetical protein
VSPAGCPRSPHGRTSGSRSSIAPWAARPRSSDFRPRSCPLKVSGANETREPNGEPTSTDTRPHQATSSHGPHWWMPHQATSSDCNNSPYKRGAAGSNPAAPTSFCRSTALLSPVVIVKEVAGSQTGSQGRQMILFVVGRCGVSVRREAPVLARELIPGGRAWQRSPAPVESPGPDAKPVKTSVASRQAGAEDCVG